MYRNYFQRIVSRGLSTGILSGGLCPGIVCGGIMFREIMSGVRDHGSAPRSPVPCIAGLAGC